MFFPSFSEGFIKAWASSLDKVLGAGVGSAGASGVSLGASACFGLGASAMSSIASAMSSVRTSPLATITSISEAFFPLIFLNTSTVFGANTLPTSIVPPRAVPITAPPPAPKPSSFSVGKRPSSITATDVVSPAPIAAPCAACEPSCFVSFASFEPCLALPKNGMVFTKPANKARPWETLSRPSIF